MAVQRSKPPPLPQRVAAPVRAPAASVPVAPPAPAVVGPTPREAAITALEAAKSNAVNNRCLATKIALKLALQAAQKLGLI